MPLISPVVSPSLVPESPLPLLLGGSTGRRPLGASVGRVLRTVRHLRLDQLTWRVRALALGRLENVIPHRFTPRVANARLRAESLERINALYRPIPATASDSAADTIELLGQAVRFSGGDQWWLPELAGIGRLFQFHVHYHDWLLTLVDCGASSSAESVLTARLLISDWIDTCRPVSAEAFRNAWHPFVIATRLKSWGKLLATSPGIVEGAEDPLAHAIAVSAAAQASRLTRRLERDVLANHFLRDAVGLLWAARIVDHPARGEWLRIGHSIALTEIREQVLPDGGHFERSPSYHLEVLDDVLDVFHLLAAEHRSPFEDAIRRMTDWIAARLHPDGDIPLFNDAVLKGAITVERMLACARSSIGAPELQHVAHHEFSVNAGPTGLVAARSPRACLFLDAGPGGPDYQPGHTHADALSLEVSVDGYRLIVDPGTYGYAADERRHYDRSTLAHNTVCVGGYDSAEVWGVFRVGRRWTPRLQEYRAHDWGVSVTASVNGPHGTTHRREIELRDESLGLTDHISGVPTVSVPIECTGGFLLHPSWTVSDVAPNTYLCRHTSGSVVTVRLDGVRWSGLIERAYHPKIGVELPGRRIEWRGLLHAGSSPIVVRSIIELSPTQPQPTGTDNR